MDTTASVAPPYVVRPFRLSPFSALMLAPSGVGDPASARAFARPYTEVPRRLREWQTSGRIQRDSSPALYLHEYTAAGVTIRGLVGKLDLARTSRSCPHAEQAVFPHEGVHALQVSELAERMHEMQLNPAPILLVHRGPAAMRELVHELIRSPPDWSFSDRAEQLHRIWALRDPALLARITSELSDTRALIADGHHRYAAYLRLQEAHPGTSWDEGLAMLVDQSDTPLWLGPIHRFLAGARLTELVAASQDAPGVRLASQFSRRGLGAPGRPNSRGLRQRTMGDPDPARRRSARRDGLGERAAAAARCGQAQYSFHHSAESALVQTRTHTGTCILMPIPAFDAVADAAGAGILLPEKATSFQPKPSLGVVMRSLPDG